MVNNSLNNFVRVLWEGFYCQLLRSQKHANRLDYVEVNFKIKHLKKRLVIN